MLGLAPLCAAPEPKFEPKTIDPGVQIGYGLAIGDVDGDGKSDILLADAKEFVWYKNPTWEKAVIAKNLTPPRDNVCIAARDIDGDGKVEIAVGGNWNPGETSDESASGSVHYLVRPAEPGKEWTPVRLPHEPTVHRMHWVSTGAGKFALVVAPLHGRGNKNGSGEHGAKILAYVPTADPSKAENWKTELIWDKFRITHNFDLLDHRSARPPGQSALPESILLGGKEGLALGAYDVGQQKWQMAIPRVVEGSAAQKPFEGIGEVRAFRTSNAPPDVVTIEPFHGPNLVYYSLQKAAEPTAKRYVIDTSFNQGHALACGDLLGTGQDQIVAGWREPNAEKKVGIKLYWRAEGGAPDTWQSAIIDDNRMACEDLKLADLDGDGKLDIVAAGRATKNLIIYWNKTGAAPEPPQDGAWRPKLDNQEWALAEVSLPGTVDFKDNEIHLSWADGVNGVKYIGKDEIPVVDYELSWEAKRIEGGDFFGAATFPVRGKDTCATFINGGWGGAVTGISCLDGSSANDNKTCTFFQYQDGEWYKFRVLVTAEHLVAYIGEKKVVNASIKDVQISLRPGDIEACAPFGFASYMTKSAIRNVAIRKLQPGEKIADDDSF